MRLKHGFTLVELLVVIAIIGVLIALLLPTVQAGAGIGATTAVHEPASSDRPSNTQPRERAWAPAFKWVEMALAR